MPRTTHSTTLAGLTLALALAACSAPDAVGPRPGGLRGSADLEVPDEAPAAEVGLRETVDGINGQLARDAAPYRILKAEWLSTAEAHEASGNVVVANDRGNRRLASDFVPNDPRRAGWSGASIDGTDDLTYAIDGTGDAIPPGGGLTAARTTAAIVRAMGTWDALGCSTIELRRRNTGAVDLGFIAAQLSGGLVGSFAVGGDIQHAGWRDLNFATGVLGVTFTVVFVDPATGIPTDIDGDGREDVAFREIYYDPSYVWADDGVANVDVESVAVHEVGHGLSQDHFGRIAIDAAGNVKKSPFAVMNAAYSGPVRELHGSDVGAHCNGWGSWPNN